MVFTGPFFSADPVKGGIVRPRLKGMNIQVLADDKDTGDGGNAHEQFQSAAAVENHVSGNGEQEDAEGASGSVFDQHADELNADDKVKCMFQENMEGVVVSAIQQVGHFPDDWDDTDEKAGQYDNRYGNFHDFCNQLQPVCEGPMLSLTACHVFDTLLLLFFGWFHAVGLPSGESVKMVIFFEYSIFPKHYDYNLGEPRSYPYEGTPMDSSVLTTENFNEYTGKQKEIILTSTGSVRIISVI